MGPGMSDDVPGLVLVADSFEKFPKVPRLNRDCIITEKIDGTNAQVYIQHFSKVDLLAEGRGIMAGALSYHDLANGMEAAIWAGSRSRWLTRDSDNMGFAAWVEANGKELLGLGQGRHYGEWWGKGIQRNYGLDYKVFSLFNTVRWNERMFKMFKHEPWKARQAVKRDANSEPIFVRPPDCCKVVPVISAGLFVQHVFEGALAHLKHRGSVAAPGFMNPEGIMIFHTGANHAFKITFEGDDSGKEWGA